MLMVTAVLWAGYTLPFRKSGLTPWQASALVNACSALVSLLTGLCGAWLLNEQLSGSSLAEIGLTTAGVALGSGALSRAAQRKATPALPTKNFL